MDLIFVAIATLLILSILASKLSERLGVPALLFFLGIGMIVGSGETLRIQLTQARFAQTLGLLTLALILFSAGLDTEWKVVKPIFWKSLRLATLGVVGTALLVGLASYLILSLPFLEALLVGAIISSTDAAAVFTVLRSRQIRLNPSLKSLLEFESGSNDPMAVFLTLSLIELILSPQESLWQLIPMFFIQMSVGSICGYFFGIVLLRLLRNIQLEYEGLYPALTIAFILLTYGLTTLLGGSGFLAVYFCGLKTGSAAFPFKTQLKRFHDGIAWIMQILMFLILGVLVIPHRLLGIAPIGILLSFILIVFARPLSVFVSLVGSGMNFREKLLISWVGLRGAAPIVLATFPLLAGVAKSELIFHLVFFITLTSVLIQGPTLSWMAKKLDLALPFYPKKSFPLAFEPQEEMSTQLVDLIVPYRSQAVGKTIEELQLPADILITLVCRNEVFLVPTAQTRLEEGDILQILTEEKRLEEIQNILHPSSSHP